MNSETAGKSDSCGLALDQIRRVLTVIANLHERGETSKSLVFCGYCKFAITVRRALHKQLGVERESRPSQLEVRLRDIVARRARNGRILALQFAI